MVLLNRRKLLGSTKLWQASGKVASPVWTADLRLFIINNPGDFFLSSRFSKLLDSRQQIHNPAYCQASYSLNVCRVVRKNGDNSMQWRLYFFRREEEYNKCFSHPGWPKRKGYRTLLTLVQVAFCIDCSCKSNF